MVSYKSTKLLSTYNENYSKYRTGFFHQLTMQDIGFLPLCQNRSNHYKIVPIYVNFKNV